MIDRIRAPTKMEMAAITARCEAAAKKDPASAFWWWPKIRDLDIPQPRTVMVERTYLELVMMVEPGEHKIPPEVCAAARQIGYPLFARSDQSAAKHDWDNTCHVRTEGDLAGHLKKIALHDGMAGYLSRGWMFRELLELEHDFKVFRGMPCATEWRCFVNDGRLECAHPYWSAETILDWYRGDMESYESFRPFSKPPPGWREMLAGRYAERPAVLEEYASLLAVMPGKWSADFAKHVDGTWYLTDMAPAGLSYHPECGLAGRG